MALVQGDRRWSRGPCFGQGPVQRGRVPPGEALQDLASAAGVNALRWKTRCLDPTAAEDGPAPEQPVGHGRGRVDEPDVASECLLNLRRDPGSMRAPQHLHVGSLSLRKKLLMRRSLAWDVFARDACLSALMRRETGAQGAAAAAVNKGPGDPTLGWATGRPWGAIR